MEEYFVTGCWRGQVVIPEKAYAGGREWRTSDGRLPSETRTILYRCSIGKLSQDDIVYLKKTTKLENYFKLQAASSIPMDSIDERVKHADALTRFENAKKDFPNNLEQMQTILDVKTWWPLILGMIELQKTAETIRKHSKPAPTENLKMSQVFVAYYAHELNGDNPESNLILKACISFYADSKESAISLLTEAAKKTQERCKPLVWANWRNRSVKHKDTSCKARIEVLPENEFLARFDNAKKASAEIEYWEWVEEKEFANAPECDAGFYALWWCAQIISQIEKGNRHNQPSKEEPAFADSFLRVESAFQDFEDAPIHAMAAASSKGCPVKTIPKQIYGEPAAIESTEPAGVVIENRQELKDDHYKATLKANIDAHLIIHKSDSLPERERNLFLNEQLEMSPGQIAQLYYPNDPKAEGRIKQQVYRDKN